MATLVLIGIIVVMLLVLFVQMFRKKPVKKLLLSYGVLLGGYYLYVTYTCGPNMADVRVMKPMAQKIADYIVANGIPESLKDIPNLPYKLEGCKRVEEYRNYSNNKSTKEEAYFYDIDEVCKYANNISIDFGVSIFLKDNAMSCRIELTSPNETVLSYSFRRDKNNSFEFGKIDIGSRKDDGICNPMRM